MPDADNAEVHTPPEVTDASVAAENPSSSPLLEQFARAAEAAKEQVKEQTEAEQLKALGLPSNVKIENAEEPMELQQPKANAKGPWVQYNGIATVRTMDEAAWRNVDVDSDRYFEWNYLNKKRVPSSSFTDEELQYLLRRDGRFTLVED